MTLTRYSALTVAATFALLVVGGTVNPTGSSLACPDWPTCYGSFFPEMKDGVQYEHTHRVVATLVGMLTLGLAVWLWRTSTPARALRWFGAAAAGLVVFQGVLGGVTVLLRLPLAVSTGHLAIAMFFFALTIYLAFRVWRLEADTESPPLFTGLTRARWLAAATGLAVYGQILLGALVRHTRSGRACLDEIPFCNGGEVWPAWGPGQLHMAHRILGVIVALVILGTALPLAKEALRKGQWGVYFVVFAGPILGAVQVGLGVLTVTTFIGVVPVTLHLAVGALLWGMYVYVFLALALPGRVPVIQGPPEPAGAPGWAPKSV